MKKRLISFAVTFILLFPMFLIQCFAADFSEDAEAIELAAASVVKLYIYDENGEEIATGSGFVAIDNQTVITNYHVIRNGKKVTAVSDAGKKYELSILYCADKEYDIAILGFDSPSDLSPLSLNKHDELRRGEKIVTIGSPIGITNTVSIGNISAIYEEDGIPWIQFTAPISNGSSGGPLLNDSGIVIGIVSAYYVNGQNLNLAIDISIAKAMYNGWNGKPNSIGDNITEAVLDFSDSNYNQTDEFANWTLFNIEDMDIYIPNHFVAYTLDELKKNYSVLNKQLNASEWASYFEDNSDLTLYLRSQQNDNYDIEVYVYQTEQPSYHIYNIDEMKKLIEAKNLLEEDNIIEYCVLDHSQTLFKAIKTNEYSEIYEWNIWTIEKGFCYDFYFTCWEHNFNDNQEEEIYKIIKSIVLKNADIQNTKRFLRIIRGDINNIPLTMYNLSKVNMKISFPNTFGVYYDGLDNNYYLYKGREDHENFMKNTLSNNEWFIVAVNSKNEIFTGNKRSIGRKAPSKNFSDYTFSELNEYANTFYSNKKELDIIEPGRIIYNYQCPFIRVVYIEDGKYRVTYYTVYENYKYSLEYYIMDEGAIVDNNTIIMLDQIVLSIQFY